MVSAHARMGSQEGLFSKQNQKPANGAFLLGSKKALRLLATQRLSSFQKERYAQKKLAVQ